MPSSMKSVLQHAQKLGTKALSTSELFTLILGTAREGKHAQAIIECIIAERRSPAELLSLDVHELQCSGCDEPLAHRLAAVLELTRRLSLAAAPQYRMGAPADAARLVMPELRHVTQEQVYVLVLDTKNNVLSKHLLYQGTAKSSDWRAAEIYRPAIARNGTAIILCHNHPSGDPTPSPDDIAITGQLAKAGELLGIELVDHLIIGHDTYTSIKEYIARDFFEREA
jgi:DNA repair protein RadC